ncbi:MAG: 6-bladed beta-propeller [Bacteroidales bacterium]|nr:6-bladed beta-propeller [Bacteroidales bacterium]
MRSFKYLWGLALVSLLLASCGQGKDTQEEVLLPMISIDNVATTPTALKDVFLETRIIALETNDSSLIGGRQRKVIKSGERFYVRSSNDVVVFDLQGAYVGRLSHTGEGSGEYTQMLDFDVVEDRSEIWVSADRGIYRYSAATMDFIDLLELPYVATRFKYLPDYELIVMQTVDEEVYKVCQMDGEVVAAFLPQEEAISGLSPIAFQRVGEKIVSQLETSNTAISFTPSTLQFELEDIIPPVEGLETLEINREYFQRYGYRVQAMKVTDEFIGISSFRQVDDKVLMVLRMPGGKWCLNVASDADSHRYCYYPLEEATLTTDLTPTADPRFINTLSACESPDSFLFLIDSDDPDANPSLLEVKNLH